MLVGDKCWVENRKEQSEINQSRVWEKGIRTFKQNYTFVVKSLKNMFALNKAFCLVKASVGWEYTTNLHFLNYVEILIHRSFRGLLSTGNYLEFTYAMKI